MKIINHLICIKSIKTKKLTIVLSMVLLLGIFNIKCEAVLIVEMNRRGLRKIILIILLK